MPTPMPEEWVSNAVAEVIENLDEERSRTLAGFGTGGSTVQQDQEHAPRSQGDSRWLPNDPDTASGKPEADFGNIWRMLPALRDIPAEMLRTLPLSTVLQLNEALSRETRLKKLMDADAKL
jgi:hypothetical protein